MTNRPPVRDSKSTGVRVVPMERQPSPGAGWRLIANHSGLRNYAPRFTVWRRHGLLVSSSTTSAGELGIVGHIHTIAVSRQGGRRPRRDEFLRAVRDFGMEHALETTMSHGMAVQVWSPVPVGVS